MEIFFLIVISLLIASTIGNLVRIKNERKNDKESYSYLQKLNSFFGEIKKDPDFLDKNYGEIVNSVHGYLNSTSSKYRLRLTENIDFYEKIFNMLDENYRNMNAWRLFDQSLARLLIRFFLMKSQDSQYERIAYKALNLMVDIFFRDVSQEVSDYIVSTFSSMKFSDSGFNKSPQMKNIASDATKRMYEISLKKLEEEPNKENKILALNLGRLCYSISRPDNKVTMYDEQSINNDISVRCKNV